ncbi:unnamed protein product [Pipistrellus nathusii]|uniref:Uncharacterized protein n=1 Tax=Pipistrellus nathusii TaxID=59473 RepID=A0ABP0AMA4_PIPNA
MPNRKTKEETRPLCKMRRNHAIWEEAKPRSLEEMSGWGGLSDLSLIFVGPYLMSMSTTNEVRDNREKMAVQRMEIRRKNREQQMRHVTRFQIPEPDHHYDFCLIP